MSKKAANTEAPVRVLKNGTCPNLSGKSTLSYRIGVDESGEIMLQLVGNSNPGYFNAEWVPYADCPGVAGQAGSGQGHHVVCPDAAVPGQEHQLAIIPVRCPEA